MLNAVIVTHINVKYKYNTHTPNNLNNNGHFLSYNKKKDHLMKKLIFFTIKTNRSERLCEKCEMIIIIRVYKMKY